MPKCLRKNVNDAIVIVHPMVRMGKNRFFLVRYVCRTPKTFTFKK